MSHHRKPLTSFQKNGVLRSTSVPPPRLAPPRHRGAGATTRVLRGKCQPVLRGADCDVTEAPYGARGTGGTTTLLPFSALNERRPRTRGAPPRDITSSPPSSKSPAVTAGFTFLTVPRCSFPTIASSGSVQGTSCLPRSDRHRHHRRRSRLYWQGTRAATFRPHLSNLATSRTHYCPTRSTKMRQTTCWNSSATTASSRESASLCHCPRSAKDQTCSHNGCCGCPWHAVYIHDVNFTTGDDNVAAHANPGRGQLLGTGHGASIGSL